MTNLELLAHNVHSWPDNAFAVIWGEGEPVWLSQEDINNTMFPIFISDWLAERERIQNKPKWERAPEWANWLAQDLDGTWAWYQKKPYTDHEEFLEDTGRLAGYRSGQVIGDWRQTIEQRPESKAEEKTKMEYKFKVGDKVEAVVAGYGCNSEEIGTISTITELGIYTEGPGYRVNNLENKYYDDFIGEVSFKLHSPAVIESDRQHPAAAQADYPESITPVIDFEQECLSCTDGLKKQSNEIAMSSLYPDYYKSCVGLTELDVYAVHHLFKVNDPSGCVQHASKKLLLSGVRTGGKSAYKDIKEARDTLTRKLQLMEQFQENI